MAGDLTIVNLYPRCLLKFHIIDPTLSLLFPIGHQRGVYLLPIYSLNTKRLAMFQYGK